MEGTVLKRPRVFVTRRLPDAIETRMRELFAVRFNEDDAPLTPEALVTAMQEADILVPTIADRLPAALIMQAGSALRLIAQFGTGIDNVDVAAALDHGITVTNTPGVLTDDTADMTMGLILSVSRRLVEGAGLIPAERWSGWSPTFMLGHRLTGRSLGILGMGRIGQAVARRARAFGLAIHYHNRHRLPVAIEAGLGATYWDSLDQMLARMDILSVNCPHTPATYQLLSARRLKLLPREAVVVNTARGEVIDEAALAAMLEAGDLAGAGLDVFEHEPTVSRKLRRLAQAGRVTLLPHMGSATIEGRIEMGQRVILNIQSFADGHRPPDRVLRSML